MLSHFSSALRDFTHIKKSYSPNSIGESVASENTYCITGVLFPASPKDMQVFGDLTATQTAYVFFTEEEDITINDTVIDEGKKMRVIACQKIRDMDGKVSHIKVYLTHHQ